MKIIASSDLHGNIQAYENLANVSKEFNSDVIIIAGDLTDYSLTNQEKLIKNILLPLNKQILFIMGNDDESEWESKDNFTNINQKSVMIKNINFVGYQYTNPFVGSQFEKIERDQKNDFVELSTVINNQTILVTHGPCYGILDMTILGNNAGSKALLDLCNTTKPKYHLFGHIHEDYGKKNNHFNISYPLKKRFLFLNLENDDFNFIK